VCSSSDEQREKRHSTAASQARNGTPLAGQDIRASFPRRPVIDLLINFYLQEINWLYEIIHPPSFLERYDTWWSKTEYINYDDIQFGILILRICCNSILFLPHAKYPTNNLIDIPLDLLAQRCHDAADRLDHFHPWKSSYLRVQQLFQKAIYEKGRARVKESWFLLNDAISIAQDLALHSEKISAEFTSVDMEMRRRLFWSLYVWDKFVSLHLSSQYNSSAN
jgi:hypothetical protein